MGGGFVCPGPGRAATRSSGSGTPSPAASSIRWSCDRHSPIRWSPSFSGSFSDPPGSWPAGSSWARRGRRRAGAALAPPARRSGPGSPPATGASSWPSARRSVRCCSRWSGWGSRRTTTSCTTTISARAATSSCPADSCSSSRTPGTYLLVNQLEGKHDTLSCHCLPPLQAEGPDQGVVLLDHGAAGQDPAACQGARGPICEQCHVQGEAKKTWQRIASTAGHRTHLESDSAALKKVAVPHLPRPHRPPIPAGRHDLRPEGLPPDRRGPDQAGPDGRAVRSGQPEAAAQRRAALLQLLPPVHGRGPVRVTRFGRRARCGRASASASAATRCAGCSRRFDPDKDPHGGSCGMCHNPHTDAKPKDALKSCTDAGCHSNWRDVPFHVGAAHRKVGQRCETCHQPHAAGWTRATAPVATQEVRKGEGRMRPPLPFDTTKALRQSLRLVDPGRSRGQGDAATGRSTGEQHHRNASPSDTFSHQRHRKLACITCHSTTSRRSDLTFEPPRGCQICHHQAPARSECATCHESDELDAARPLTVEVAVPKHAPRPRPVAFEHSAHVKLALRAVPYHAGLARAGATSRGLRRLPRRAPQPARPTAPPATERRRSPPAHARPVDAHAGCVECHDAVDRHEADPEAVVLPDLPFLQRRPLRAKGMQPVPPPVFTRRPTGPICSDGSAARETAPSAERCRAGSALACLATGTRSTGLSASDRHQGTDRRLPGRAAGQRARDRRGDRLRPAASRPRMASSCAARRAPRSASSFGRARTVRVARWSAAWTSRCGGSVFAG